MSSATLNTPSPSPPAPTRTASVSRRQPRKSTLTQQQKNQKRQRATQDQLVTLEAEFNKNPTPTASTRERIAQEINMTERSVQIWFQNRRAKIKTLAKKSMETGEECPEIPESMRQYLAMQAMDSGKSYRSFGDRRGMGYGAGNLFPISEPNSQSKLVIQYITARSLSIGSWRRVGQNSMDLVVFYSPEKACFTYYINNDQSGYKIEFPFSYINDISLEPTEPNDSTGQKQGQLVINVSRPPNFYMDSPTPDYQASGFYQVHDFTEDRQASQILTHCLGGNYDVLYEQLNKLRMVDSFINRHNTLPIYHDQPTLSLSAPVSPHIVRPASSNDIHHYHEQPQPMQQFHAKHRRTRSRSVPAAIDFSQLNMPSFTFQSHDAQSPGHLYAPAPQHTHALVTSPLGHPDLRIDTTASQFLDFRPGSASAYPLSATTASPSEYGASPSLINASLHQDNGYGTPYSMPYLSPMQDPTGMSNAAMSPISMTDPIIASGSPPLGRCASAEIYGGSYADHGILPEDLNELYAKQTLCVSPVPQIHEEQAQQEVQHGVGAPVDMTSLMQYPLSAHLDDAGL